MLYDQFKKIIFLDFEFRVPKGDDIQNVHCMAAMERYSGEIWTLDADELAACKENPLPTGDDVCYVAFAAAAELQCFLKLGWEMPKNVIDLRYEWLRWQNGNMALPKSPKGIHYSSLIWALHTFKITTSTSSAHKEAMRRVCIDNERLPEESKQAVLDYCLEDVRPMIELADKLLLKAGPLEQVLFRGRYAAVEAAIASRGMPIDTETYNHIIGQRKEVVEQLVADSPYDFFYATGQVAQKPLAAYLIQNDMEWRKTENGSLKTDVDTFQDAAERYPQLQIAFELVKLFTVLQDMANLPIGHDGRCRYFQNPFGSLSSRHYATQNPFSMKKWVRYLIQPKEGKAFITADWSSQEVGIGAYLSNDPNMKEVFQQAIVGGDVYMKFAELAGIVPAGAKRADHELLRSRAKTTFLAANYGAGAETIANRLGTSKTEASRLLNKYREVFSTYLEWTQKICDHAFQLGELETLLGWKRQITKDPSRHNELPNARSVINFPVQGNGAEVMRVAAIIAHDNGLKLIGTVHDSLIIESDIATAESDAARLVECMDQATQALLSMPSAVDVSTAIHPDRYRDKDGAADWERACEIFQVPEGSR